MLKVLNYFKKKSPWILYLDTGSCNGCDIEWMSTIAPRFDIERFGCLIKNNPRHADIFIVAGTVTKQIKKRLIRIYEQIPNPKVVVALGGCCCSKEIYKDCYNIEGPLNKIIPIDVYVPGCPPKPEGMINGLLEAIKIFGEKK